MKRSDFWLLIAIFAGVLLGVLAGAVEGAGAVRYQWLGVLFLKALKMMIVPLIVSSMIVGVTSIGDPRSLGRTGMVTIVYYTITTAISVLIGLILVNLIRPGAGVAVSTEIPDLVRGKESFQFIDVLMGMIPENIVSAAANLQILPLIIFSLFFGGILTTLGERGRPVVQLFEVVNDVVMKMVNIILWYAPIGVFGLIAGKLGEAGGLAAFWGEFLGLLKYCMTVIVGLAIHAMIVLPLFLRFAARRSPWQYVIGMVTALTTAFTTASSSATLPTTFEGVTERNKVNPESANLVLPLGATINMDGTALYEAVAAMFIAQSYGISLTMGDQVIIFLTATLAAIGAAGIPQAGLVTMILVLQAVHLPLEGIAMILAVDWFLDRIRTTVNVWGDSVGAAVVERWIPFRKSTSP